MMHTMHILCHILFFFRMRGVTNSPREQTNHFQSFPGSKKLYNRALNWYSCIVCLSIFLRKVKNDVTSHFSARKCAICYENITYYHTTCRYVTYNLSFILINNDQNIALNCGTASLATNCALFIRIIHVICHQ